MSTVAEAEELVFSLSEKERAELIGKMIRSLPSPFVAEDEDWVEEALRRDREMDEKPETVLTEEQFFTSLREYVRK
ncbi:MAG: addiction module protein [Chloracidobacterium sp.]|nr:addiction module protein [Chloracidobacterium sp.]